MINIKRGKFPRTDTASVMDDASTLLVTPGPRFDPLAFVPVHLPMAPAPARLDAGLHELARQFDAAPDIGCVRCHRRALTLTNTTETIRLSTPFTISCVRCAVSTTTNINVLAIARAAPTQTVERVMQAIRNHLLDHGWTYWAERETHAEVVRLMPSVARDLKRSVAPMLAPLHGACVYAGTQIIEDHFAPTLPPAERAGDPIGHLAVEIAQYAQTCSKCGARTWYRCRDGCSRARSTIERTLIWRDTAPLKYTPVGVL